MPAQLAPPLFKTMLEEVQFAIEDVQPFLSQGKDYKFSYYLFISKIYKEVASRVDAEGKKKKRKKEDNIPFYYFQAEDEVLEECCETEMTFDYKPPNQQSSDSRGIFSEMGIDGWRRVMVVKAERMLEVLEKMTSMLGST